MSVGASARERARLTAALRAQGAVRSANVEAALMAVPREQFIPQTMVSGGLLAVYRDDAIVTKWDAQGQPLSSSSQPAMMAEMLELLQVPPAARVLEIGTGTGYNAALLAQLAGSRGALTSIDIDPQLAATAARALDGAGVAATVLSGDGRAGYPPGAPYDRIIVTAAAAAISRAWFDQLAEGGRVVVPLRTAALRGALQPIPALQRAGGVLRSVGLTFGSFMPVHGGDGGWSTGPAGDLAPAPAVIRGLPDDPVQLADQLASWRERVRAGLAAPGLIGRPAGAGIELELLAP